MSPTNQDRPDDDNENGINNDDLMLLYLDGLADEAEVATLSDRMRSQPQFRERFRLLCVIDASLSDVSSLELTAEEAPPSKSQGSAVDNVPRPAARRRVASLFLAATSLTLIFGLLFWQSGGNSIRSDVATPNLGVVVASPEETSDESVLFATGQAVQVGQWELTAGVTRVRLDSGVDLAFNGPALFELHTPMSGTLSSGEVTATVEERAIGFRLEAAQLEVVDLGTSFRVRVDRGEASVDVLDGEVEARVDGGNADRLLASESLTVSRDGRTVRGLAKQPDEPTESTSQRSPYEVSGDLRWLEQMPSDLRPQRFEHEYVLAMRERRNVDLAAIISTHAAVLVPQPGRTPQADGSLGFDRLFASNADDAESSWVDVVLLHFDGFGQNALERSDATGVIRFDRPIAAVIIDGRALNATDIVCGDPNTTYGTKPVREFDWDSKPEMRDYITISGDRRSLSVQLKVSFGVDQIRVLLPSDAATKDEFDQ